MMKVKSIEDVRRVFIATVRLIYLNDKEESKKYELTRNEDRLNLPNNSGDVINIPSREFKKALSIVLRQFGLHPEQKSAFVKAFIELHWIMRPKDRPHRRYKKTTTSRCKVGGKEAAVFRVDRIIFDFLETMDGEKALDISNNIISIPQRNPDGDLIVVNGVTTATSVTVGTVSDKRYEAVMAAINKGIKAKSEQQI